MTKQNRWLIAGALVALYLFLGRRKGANDTAGTPRNVGGPPL